VGPVASLNAVERRKIPSPSPPGIETPNPYHPAGKLWKEVLRTI